MVGNQYIYGAILAIMESLRLQGTSPTGQTHKFHKRMMDSTCVFPLRHMWFRHSKSVNLLQSGVNLIYIMDFLGHSDCSTTQIYAKADTD